MKALFTLWPIAIVLLCVAWYYRFNICFALLWVLAVIAHRSHKKIMRDAEIDLDEYERALS